VWTDAIAFECQGVRIGIRTDDPRLFASIGRRVPPSAVPITEPMVDALYSIVGGGRDTPGVRRYSFLYAAAARVVRTLDEHELLDALDTEIKMFVAERTTSRLCLHAGVVGWKGSAIVIPGGSHSGKTTLVTALLAAGAEYYSDDCAFIDDDGLVHPFATALSVRDATGGPQRKVRPDTLGACTGEVPLPISLLVLMRYVPGESWDPQTLSPGRAVVALVPWSASVRGNPARTFGRLTKLATTARVLRGVHGDAVSLANDLLLGDDER
jgi:hypothetical protein